MKKFKKSYLSLLILVLLGTLIVGCGETTDYSNYFSILQISKFDDDKENMLEVEYEVNNLGKKENMVFCVTINGMTEKYSVSSGNKKSDKMIIDVGHPDNYQLTYPVVYEVMKNGDVVWSKEDSISYDCTEMFQHKATIKYGNETAEVDLTDYQSNYYNLADLFTNFDAKSPHKVELNNANKDIARIQEGEESEGKTESVAYGSVLRLATRGDNELNDTYHFSDNLEIIIADAVLASSIKWDDHMEFSDDSNYSSDIVSTFEMDVIIDNPSDETVYGSVTKFYVNDTEVSDKYLAASENISISSGETDKVYNYSGPYVWMSTGETNIKKFGLKVKLEDSNGEVLYDDIQWLYLK